MAPLRVSITKSEWLPDDLTAFVPLRLWKSPFITTWDGSQNQNHPTDSADQGYILGNAGIFDCYDLATGKEIYRERLPHQGSGFSASPVASDGRIYLPSEDGDIFVVKAGPRFELLQRNAMGEPLMATPAISGGLLLTRTEHTLWAIGNSH